MCSDRGCLWLNFHAESFLITGVKPTNTFKKTTLERKVLLCIVVSGSPVHGYMAVLPLGGLMVRNMYV